MRNLAILGCILRKVCIEQQHRLPPAEMTLDHVQPRADPDQPRIDRHCDLGLQEPGPVRWLPRIRVLALMSLLVDFLSKVPCPAHETHGHQRQSQVGCGAHRVAGEDAQTACIGRDFVAQGDLHGEVRDARFVDEFIGHTSCLTFARRCCLHDRTKPWSPLQPGRSNL